MHKRHLSHALLAAVDAQKVLVVAEDPSSIKGLIADIRTKAESWQEGLVKSASYVNGDTRIDLVTGGTIRIVTGRDVGGRGLRGNVFDQIFLPIGTAKNFLDELTPALCTSPVGLITGY